MNALGVPSSYPNKPQKTSLSNLDNVTVNTNVQQNPAKVTKVIKAPANLERKQSLGKDTTNEVYLQNEATMDLNQFEENLRLLDMPFSDKLNV